MKYFVSLLAFLFFISCSPKAQSLQASADDILKKSFQQAAKEKKNVFLIFHAAWCGWCRKMDTAMNDPLVKDFFQNNYVITHLTVYESKGKEALENPGALVYLTKNGGDNQGIPFWMVLDKDGNVLADSQIKPKQNAGCPASKEEVSFFINILQKTSVLTPGELAAIEKRFSKIATN